MTTKRDALRDAYRNTLAAVVMHYRDRLPGDMVAEFAKDDKRHYNDTLKKLITLYYLGKITRLQFLRSFRALIEGQMWKAWLEGMDANGLTPDDMTPEQQDALQAVIDSEYNHVDKFMEDLEKAIIVGASIGLLLSRADLWVNRYPDVVNRAKIETAKPGDKFEWIYGDTQHCETCEALNGIIAYKSEWEQSGFHPQQPPNPNLSCRGWRCQCQLIPTDKRRTPNALQRLLDLVTGQYV